MTRRAWPVALLLFFSGACALLYQVVWMRALRRVFRASTPATAVVLTVFVGGLGSGVSLGIAASELETFRHSAPEPFSAPAAPLPIR